MLTNNKKVFSFYIQIFYFFVLILYTRLCIIQVIHTVYDIVNSYYTSGVTSINLSPSQTCIMRALKHTHSLTLQGTHIPYTY